MAINSHFTDEEVESQRSEKLTQDRPASKDSNPHLPGLYSSYSLQITCLSTMVIITMPAKMHRALAACLCTLPALSLVLKTTLRSGYYFFLYSYAFTS